ncbi:MAG TPA: glycosyltransferase [Flavobacteriales bacterium]|jgi:glycosyltransferase involved in cell wall biosynthesis|nr:glycosyltransferase [Flavobacteriales bacterium]
MIKINFIIAAYNEEDRIEGVINSIKKFADQIVILDPGSSDRTVEFATKSYPIQVCLVEKDMFNIESRISSALKIIKSHSTSEWIFMMNCGEKFTDELGVKLLSVINSELDLYGVSIYRQSYTFGIKTHNQKLFYIFRSFFKTNNNYRLLKYSAWDIEKSRMHAEFPIASDYLSSTIWLRPFDNLSLKHYRFGSLSDFEKKHSLYSTNEANDLYMKGRKTNVLRMCIKPLLVFIYFSPSIFVSRKAFIVGMYHVFYKFQVEAKLYMMSKKITNRVVD